MTAMYPEIEIERIRRPNRWYAIPLLGFLFKLILIIPVNIEIFFLRCIIFFASILNACNIFFRGRYWKWAYDINLGTIRLEVNVGYYLFGLTDKYPGFSLITTPDYSLKIPFNKNPNRLFATPLLGYLVRTLLMIPYLFYRHIVNMAAILAVLVSWISVLFKGRYPETTYEIVRDSLRVDQAVTAWFLGMSDTYPSWWISMRHKPLKILLLVLAVILTLWSFFGHPNNSSQQRKYQQNMYGATQSATQSSNYSY